MVLQKKILWKSLQSQEMVTSSMVPTTIRVFNGIKIVTKMIFAMEDFSLTVHTPTSQLENFRTRSAVGAQQMVLQFQFLILVQLLE